MRTPLRFPTILAALSIVASLSVLCLAAGWKDLDHPLLTSLAAADTADKVLALAPRIEAYASKHPRAEVSGEMLWRLSHAYYGIERPDDALRVLESLQMGWPKEYGGLAWVGMAEIHAMRGDSEKETACLEKAIEAPSVDTHTGIMDADNTLNRAYRRLAEIHEGRGHWERALSLYEAWHPTSWCGNEASAYDHERILGMSRCRAHLGQTDRALADIWGILVGSINGPDREAAVTYAEIAARAGKSQDARDRLKTLPEAIRTEFAPAFDSAEAFARKDPAAILSAIDGIQTRWMTTELDSGPPEMFAAARLLMELPQGTKFLSARILEGNLRAIQLAGLAGRKEMLAALTRRLDAAKGAEVDWLRGAIRKLGGVVPSGVPAPPAGTADPKA